MVRSTYQEGKIYVIRSQYTEKCYIGSTIQPLSNRFSQHKSNFKKYLKYEAAYITSYEILKFEDAYIELLELYPCNSKLELENREGELIRQHYCINKVICNRTQKEYWLDNKEKYRIYGIEYRIKKKEFIQQINKIYYENNKEHIQKRGKIYYENNKEKTLNISCIKNPCPICNKLLSNGYITAHIKRIHKDANVMPSIL